MCTLCVQATSVTRHLKACDKPTKNMIDSANELLVRAMLSHNIAPWFLESEAMKAYITMVSGGRYTSPSRYTFTQSLRNLASVISGKIQLELQRTASFSLEIDGWSRAQRKLIGVTAGGPGKKRFLTCFNVEGSENAASQAMGIHKSALEALGLSTDLAPDDDSVPQSKVSNITTDSAAVMASTADILTSEYRIFKDMTWTPCSSHHLNLVLQDQVQIFDVM